MGKSIVHDTQNFINMFKKDISIKKIKNYDRIVISGMGGSGISGRILETLAFFDSKKQIFSWNNYKLPSWVTREDLLICISYSGNTAETLSAAARGAEIGCNVQVITTGGKLEQLADENGWDKVMIEKDHQPRAALPLLLKPLIYKIGIKDQNETLNEIYNLKIVKEKIKSIVSQIKGKIPCIYSGKLLEPAGYRWRCQIEENSKQLAFHHEIPEMNHNEIVGWTINNPKMQPVLIREKNESKNIKDRFEGLKETAFKDIDYTEIRMKGHYPLTKIIEAIITGDMVSLELAKENNRDPTPVDIIENLKGKLGGK
jgi:glucose/mannose-6-phosphate isomerase